MTAAGRSRPAAVVLLAVVVVTVLSWPLATIAPGVDLDASWRVALHMAAHARLDSGTQVVFTYGPLGFLSQPLLAYPWTTRFAFAAYGLTQLAVSAVVVLGLRRMLGSLVLAVLAAIVVVAVIDQDPLSVAGFGLAWAALGRDGEGGRRGLVPVALLGALGGYAVLVKLNTGVTVLALGAVVVLLGATARRGRSAAAWAGGALVAAALGWILTGQALTAAPQYLVRSLAVVSGYSEAMGYPDPARAWQTWVVVAVAAVGALAILLDARTGGGLRSRRTLGALLLWLGFAFTAFKAGFVRQDPGHVEITLASLLGGLCVLPLRALTRVLAAAVLVAVLVAMLQPVGRTASSVVRPVAHARALLDQASVMARGTELRRRIVQARRDVGSQYAMNVGTFDAVKGHGVHVAPAFAAVAWANQLDWDPLPVFQDYLAYTGSLDRLNARALSGPDAPARIARHSQNGTIDQRNPDWDSPAAMRALLCHYRELYTAPGWEALGRVPSRCGAPRPLRTVTARLGQAVPIPAAGAGEYSWVQIDGAAVAGTEVLRSALLRARGRSVTLDGRRGYRVVPGTLEDGLVLSVPRAADFAGEFALDQGARTLTLREAGVADGTVRLRFYAAPITR
jgi:hypothetical protein